MTATSSLPAQITIRADSSSQNISRERPVEAAFKDLPGPQTAALSRSRAVTHEFEPAVGSQNMAARSPEKLLSADFFQRELIFGTKNSLWGKVKHNSTTISHHEDALRYGARYTIEEIAAHLGVDNKRISTRLSDAKDVVAKDQGVARALVKRAFDDAQAHFGVKKRKDLLAATRRKAAKTTAIDLTGDETDGIASLGDEDSAAASFLVSLSSRAWVKGVGVEECEGHDLLQSSG